MSTHVLILGGTTEARALATALAGRPDLRVTTSLAGRVSAPALIEGEVRTGGFGGAAGLGAYLRDEHVDALIDATHPFAAAISAHAAEAAARTGVPVVALRRPGWGAGPGDVWHDVHSLAEAAALLPELGRRVFLTTGRQGLAEFAGLAGHFLVRSVEPPEPPLPADTEVLLARGPFTVADETELLRTHRIDVLVTKDSGGAATAAKLVAARELGVPVVVVRRPPVPAGVPAVPDVAGALAWLDSGVAGHGSSGAAGRGPGGVAGHGSSGVAGHGPGGVAGHGSDGAAELSPGGAADTCP
ncbi:cobalt-precorrin-6A reductase [Streptomyces sp. TRM66268-LWL]|uniref:Cobalt-precorrin-6A reductase n=1 Tax=Streptomyces polyasparticus TaxID=2767826 RepID=A0ABR7SDZ4_9ACTN|nr:cobalt-precorrin-6A reductase [Streptomyces polyasparticus]